MECPYCAMTTELLNRLKKLGCEHCITVFEEEVVKLNKNTWSVPVSNYYQPDATDRGKDV